MIHAMETFKLVQMLARELKLHRRLHLWPGNRWPPCRPSNPFWTSTVTFASWSAGGYFSFLGEKVDAATLNIRV